MTTIVYRDGVLAADRRMLRHGWLSGGTAQKVFRRDDGTLLGICGDFAAGMALVEWMLSGQKGDQPKPDDTTLLVVEPSGRVMIYEGGGAHPVGEPPFWAIGSGFPAALGALHMGATAVQAVEIASKIEPNTGDGVVSVRHEGAD
jgi:hypothetical protein